MNKDFRALDFHLMKFPKIRGNGNLMLLKILYGALSQLQFTTPTFTRLNLQFLKCEGLRILNDSAIFGGVADILPTIAFRLCLQVDDIEL